MMMDARQFRQQAQAQQPPYPRHHEQEISRSLGIPMEAIEAHVQTLRMQQTQIPLEQSPSALSSMQLIQMLCQHFNVYQVEELGFGPPMAIPCLRTFMELERRLWTFVTTFIHTRHIAIVAECEVEFLHSEQVEHFTALGLGNSFLHTQAVQSVFQCPRTLRRHPKISTGDILQHLRTYHQSLAYELRVEKAEFIGYLCMQYHVNSLNELGVKILSLGVYMSWIGKLRNQEKKQMAQLEEDFRQDMAAKIFRMTKEKFSESNRTHQMEQCLKQFSSLKDADAHETNDSLVGINPMLHVESNAIHKLRAPKNTTLATDILHKVTAIDTYLDKMISKYTHTLPENILSLISKRDLQVRFKVENDDHVGGNSSSSSSSGSSGNKKVVSESRARILVWVLCSIIAKIQGLLGDIQPTQQSRGDGDGSESDSSSETTTEAEDSGDDEDEDCLCCCVGKEACVCNCTCSCHDEDEKVPLVAPKATCDHVGDASMTCSTEEKPQVMKTKDTQALNDQETTKDEVIQRILQWTSQQQQSESESGLQFIKRMEDDLSTISSNKTSDSFLSIVSELVDAGRFKLKEMTSSSSLATEASSSSSTSSSSSLLSLSPFSRKLKEQAIAFTLQCLDTIFLTKAISFNTSSTTTATRAAATRSAATGTTGAVDSTDFPQEIQEAITRQIVKYFHVRAVEDLGCGSVSDLIQMAALQRNPTNEGDCMPRRRRATMKSFYALTCLDKEQHRMSQSTLVSNQEGLIQFMQHVPCLVSLEKALNWQTVFQSTFGDLRTFLQDASFHVPNRIVLELKSMHDDDFVFVHGSASADKFLKAGMQGDAREMAIQLVSLLVQHESSERMPMQLLKNHLRFILQHWSSTATRGGGETKKKTSLAGFSRDETTPGRLVKQTLDAMPMEMRKIFNAFLLGELRKVKTTRGDGLALLLQQEWLNSDEGRYLVFEYGFKHHVPALITEFTRRLQHRGAQVGMESMTNTTQEAMVSTEPKQSHVFKGQFEEVEKVEAVKVKEMPRAVDYECRNDSSSDAKDASLTTRSKGDQVNAALWLNKSRSHAIIADIRRNEFGIGMDLSVEGNSILKTQHLRLERALKRLSEELYSKDTHFVLELIQNADDNQYDTSTHPTIEFHLRKDQISFYNNEMGFTERNVRALCDIGASTKPRQTMGYIGQKGIGFKSIFRITDRPEIFSNQFQFYFDTQNHTLGYILPHWLEHGESKAIGKSNSKLNSASCHERSASAAKEAAKVGPLHDKMSLFMKGTWMNFPFKAKFQASVASRHAIFNHFLDIQPTLLLFLNRIQEIGIYDQVRRRKQTYRKKLLKNAFVELSVETTKMAVDQTCHIEESEGEGEQEGEIDRGDQALNNERDDTKEGTTCSIWKIQRKSVEIPLSLQDEAYITMTSTEEKPSTSARHALGTGVKSSCTQRTEIVFAFPQSPCDAQATTTSTSSHVGKKPYQEVYAFLPLHSYGFRFIIQANFIVPSSREALDCDSEWNQWLFSELPSLFVECWPAFQEGYAGFSLSDYFDFIPLALEVQPPFQSVAKEIASRLLNIQCIPVEPSAFTNQESMAWMYPHQAIYFASDELRALVAFLSDDLLANVLGKYVVASSVFIPVATRQMLGIEEFSLDHLLRILTRMSRPSNPRFTWTIASKATLEASATSEATSEAISEATSEATSKASKTSFINTHDAQVEHCSNAWIAHALHAVHVLAVRTNRFEESVNALRPLALFRLQSHDLMASTATHTIFIPDEFNSNSSHSFNESSRSAAFPDIMLCHREICATLQSLAPNNRSFLHRLGCKALNMHEILQSHILPKYAAITATITAAETETATAETATATWTIEESSICPSSRQPLSKLKPILALLKAAFHHLYPSASPTACPQCKDASERLKLIAQIQSSACLVTWEHRVVSLCTSQQQQQQQQKKKIFFVLPREVRWMAQVFAGSKSVHVVSNLYFQDDVYLENIKDDGSVDDDVEEKSNAHDAVAAADEAAWMWMDWPSWKKFWHELQVDGLLDVQFVRRSVQDIDWIVEYANESNVKPSALAQQQRRDDVWEDVECRGFTHVLEHIAHSSMKNNSLKHKCLSQYMKHWDLNWKRSWEALRLVNDDDDDDDLINPNTLAACTTKSTTCHGFTSNEGSSSMLGGSFSSTMSNRVLSDARGMSKSSWPSSLLYQLRTLPWIPTLNGKVRSPFRCWLPRKEIQQVLGNCVDYACVDLVNETFTHAIGMHTKLTVDIVLDLLLQLSERSQKDCLAEGEGSVPSACTGSSTSTKMPSFSSTSSIGSKKRTDSSLGNSTSTFTFNMKGEETISIDQATHIYSFLHTCAQASVASCQMIREAFDTFPWILVSTNDVKESRRGKKDGKKNCFVSTHQVSWSSSSHSNALWATYRNDLSSLYPSHLQSFFVEVAGVQDEPTLDDLIGYTKALQGVSSEQKMQEHAIFLMKQIRRHEAYEHITPTQCDRLKGFLQGLAILPTTSHTLVSLESQALVLDIPALNALHQAAVAFDTFVPFLDVQVDDVREVLDLLYRMGVQRLSQSIVQDTKRWCNVLLHIQADKAMTMQVKREITLNVFATWAQRLGSMSVETRNQLKQQLQEVSIFPCMDTPFAVPTLWCTSSSLYVCVDEATREALHKFKDILFVYLPTSPLKSPHRHRHRHRMLNWMLAFYSFCGLPDMHDHLTSHCININITSSSKKVGRRLLTWEETLQRVLLVTQRYLFQKHPLVYERCQQRSGSLLRRCFQCRCIEDVTFLSIVYQVKGQEHLGFQKQQAFYYNAAEMTLYFVSELLNTNVHALWFEIARIFFGKQVAVEVSQVMFIASTSSQGMESTLQSMFDLDELPTTEQPWIIMHEGGGDDGNQQLEEEIEDHFVEEGEEEEEGEGETKDGEAGNMVERPRKRCKYMQHDAWAWKDSMAACRTLDGEGGKNEEEEEDGYPVGLVEPRSSFLSHLGPQLGTPWLPDALVLAGDARHRYQDVSFAKVDSKSDDVYIHPNMLSTHDREGIGRWGEAFVYQLLQRTKRPHQIITWVNEERESGKAYDLIITHAPTSSSSSSLSSSSSSLSTCSSTLTGSSEVEYIEVKSTRTNAKPFFEISMNEMDMAMKHGSNYTIYRVFNAGQATLARCVTLKNPITLIKQNVVKLALIGDLKAVGPPPRP